MGKLPKLLLLVFAGSFLVGCLPYKQQVYWQFMEEVDRDSSIYFDPPRTQYRLQVDDIIEIEITSEDLAISALFSKGYNAQQNNQPLQAGAGMQGDPFYLTGYIVDDSGMIKLPVIGKLKVEELTIAEAEASLERELLKYFNPGKYYVSVKLGGLRFSVFGEVNRSGRYVVLERNYNIYQALAQFGDMQTFAKRNDIYIMRKSKGELKMSRVDLLSEEIFDSEYFYIMPNDVIYVRPARVKGLGFGSTFLQNFNATLSFVSTTLLFIATIRSLNSN